MDLEVVVLEVSFGQNRVRQIECFPLGGLCMFA